MASRRVAGRIARLEQLRGRGPCPECGNDGSPPEVVLRTHEDDPPAGPENCPTCGRVLWFTLRFDRPNADDYA